MVVAEASSVYNVDEAVAAAGGSTVRASGLTVPALTGGESSSGVGNHAVAVSLAHATSTLGGGVMTIPGASVPTSQGSGGTSSIYCWLIHGAGPGLARREKRLEVIGICIFSSGGVIGVFTFLF